MDKELTAFDVDWANLECEEEDCEGFDTLFEQINSNVEHDAGAAITTLWESIGIDYDSIYDCYVPCLSLLSNAFVHSKFASNRSGALAGRILESLVDRFAGDALDTSDFEVAAACLIRGENERPRYSHLQLLSPAKHAVAIYFLTMLDLLHHRIHPSQKERRFSWFVEFQNAVDDPIAKASLRMAAHAIAKVEPDWSLGLSGKHLTKEELLVESLIGTSLPGTNEQAIVVLRDCVADPTDILQTFSYGTPMNLTDDSIFPWLRPNIVVAAREALNRIAQE